MRYAFAFCIGVQLSTGADPANAPAPLSALAQASANGELQLVKELIDKGESVDDSSALIEAIDHGHMDVYRYLIKQGANVNMPRADREWMTPLKAAVQTGRVTDVFEVLDDGADVNLKEPLFSAVFDGNIPVMRELVYRGADINKVNEQGLSYLFYAIDYGHRQMALDILAIGEWINCKRHGIRLEGWRPCVTTVLQSAIKMGWDDVSIKMIEAGADVNEADLDGVTPLILACSKGMTETALVLIDRGADIHRSDNTGMTALIFATQRGLTEVVKKIESIDAKVDEGSACVESSCS